MTEAVRRVLEQPDLIDLSGADLDISLAFAGLRGRPELTYQDGHRTLTFHGDDIIVQDSDLGTLATVVIDRVADVGDTTFTVVVPAVNVSEGAEQVSTLGVTASHRASTAAPGRGQLTTYAVTELTGTASQVSS